MNCKESWKPNRNTEMTQVMMMAREQANPFRMLSAYCEKTSWSNQYILVVLVNLP